MYYALLKKIDAIVEEEVTLELDGKVITCFAGVCPYQIREGNRYPVSLKLEVFDDYLVEESSKDEAGLEKLGNGFSYWVIGKLEGDVIYSQFTFQDEVLLSDYGYLNGKYIRMKVDRIDVEFLKDD